MHAVAVGDHRYLRVERVFLAVEREQGFAVARQPHDQIAGKLAGVEHMQWPVQIECQKIGDVDQGRDRPQPDRLEATAQPVGAGSVAHAAQMAAEKQRAGPAVFDLDADRRAEPARYRRGVERLEPTETRGGQIAGDAAHAQAVGAVWRHLDVDDGVAEAEQIGVFGADRRVRLQAR